MEGETRRKKRTERKRTGMFVIVAAVSFLAVAAVCLLFRSGHPWAYDGAGTPDTIRLNEEYSLERVIVLNREYRVTDIRDGRIVYGPAADHKENAQPDPEYIDVDGLTAVVVGAGKDRVLGITDSETGETLTLFEGSGTGNRWQLSEPRVFGDLLVVRIYYCDCVYRVVRNNGN